MQFLVACSRKIWEKIRKKRVPPPPQTYATGLRCTYRTCTLYALYKVHVHCMHSLTHDVRLCNSYIDTHMYVDTILKINSFFNNYLNFSFLFFVCRGHSSDHTKVFREDYGRLAELRAMVPSSVHVCVLTATATEEVKDLICSNLCLSDLKCIEQSPNRKNVRYGYVKVHSSDPTDSFDWLVDKLKREGSDMDRIIIFCQTRDQCDQLYGHFEAAIGDRRINPLEREYAMFHAWTPQRNKDNIIQSFTSDDGRVRVLFATVAFGMGIDAKGVNNIIHFGSPKTILDYMQETGRAGRDGSNSLALLIDYPRANSRRKPDDAMKAYATNSSECRRKCLLKHFKDTAAEAEFSCCSVCDQNTDFWVESACLALGKTANRFEKICRQVLPVDFSNVKRALTDYQEELLVQLPTGPSGIRTLTGDIPTGITKQLIDRLAENCSEVLSLNEFQKKHPFFNAEQGQQVYHIIEEQLTECCIIHTIHPSAVQDVESDDSSSSASQTEYAAIEFVSDTEGPDELSDDSVSDDDDDD